MQGLIRTDEMEIRERREKCIKLRFCTGNSTENQQMGTSQIKNQSKWTPSNRVEGNWQNGKKLLSVIPQTENI